MHVDPNIWRTADLSTMQAKMDARMLKRVAHAYLGSNLLTISTKPNPEGKPILTVKTFEDIVAKCKRSLACLNWSLSEVSLNVWLYHWLIRFMTYQK